MIRLAVHGERGRLGSMILEAIKEEKGIILSSPIEADVMLDVTSPAGTEEILSYCLKRSLPLVIGTTGHSTLQVQKIKEASLHIPLLLASNFSLGIDLLDEFLSLLFCRYEKGCIDIIETHHVQKKDIPSGTALYLKERIHYYSPESVVTIHSLRQPGEVGQHHLIFSFDEEKIEYTHKALSRKPFAIGALQSALFLAKQSPNFYTMRDLYATYPL